MPFRKPKPVCYNIALLGDLEVITNFVKVLSKSYKRIITGDSFFVHTLIYGADVSFRFRILPGKSLHWCPQNTFVDCYKVIVLMDSNGPSKLEENLMTIRQRMTATGRGHDAINGQMLLYMFLRSPNPEMVLSKSVSVFAEDVYFYNNYENLFRDIMCGLKREIKEAKNSLFVSLKSEMEKVDLNLNKQNTYNNTMCYERNSIG